MALEVIQVKGGKVHWWYGKEGYTWCGLDLTSGRYTINVNGKYEDLTCKWCQKRLGA